MGDSNQTTNDGVPEAAVSNQSASFSGRLKALLSNRRNQLILGVILIGLIGKIPYFLA